MSQTLTITPALSLGLSRARRFSHFLAVLFALGFLVMLAVAVSGVVFVFYPSTSSGVGHGIGFMSGFGVGFGGLSGWSAIRAMIAVELMTVPTVMVLYHMCRLFLCLAKGEVFAARPVAHLRTAGYWLTASFFTGIAAVYLLALTGTTDGLFGFVAREPLHAVPSVAIRFQDAIFIGVPLIIAAYVMDEARRIAADHAEIV
jgi:hypothetical protein